MKLALAWACALLAGLPCGAQDEKDKDPKDRHGQPIREVRVYLIDRMRPDRVYQDAAAVLTLTSKAGRSETVLLPYAGDAAPIAEATGAGLLRGVVGAPYFAELLVRDRPDAGKPAGTQAAPAPNPERPAEALPAAEVLRRVHRGGCFSRAVPAAFASEPFTATVTFRLGKETFTSEEFQGPASGGDSPEEALAAARRSLDTLLRRAEEGATFMTLRPGVVELTRDLAKLSPAGFEDPTGAVERDRQWCLAMARAIESAVAAGDLPTLMDLSRDCAPRLAAIQAAREQRTKPAEQHPPEVPVK